MASNFRPMVMFQKFKQLRIPVVCQQLQPWNPPFSWMLAQETAMENLGQVHTLTIQATSQSLGHHSGFLGPVL